MKRISDATIDRLKSISPAELVAHGIIKTAPNFRESTQHGYICPLCHSGDGGNHSNGVGDGAGTFDYHNRFYCHACNNAVNDGHKLSPIDLFAIARSLEKESFGVVVRQMANEFGLPIDYDDFDLPRRSRAKTPPKPPKSKVTPAELDLIRADLNSSDEPLKNFVESCGGKWRGLPFEILHNHGAKFIEQWTSPTSRAKKKFATPTPRILIPSGNDFYIARFCGNLDDYDGATRKFVEDNPKLNAGNTKLFLSKPDVLDSDSPIFAVEGAIDALSVQLAGFGAVALNGRGNCNLLVDPLAEKKKMPRVIILFDADEQGRKAAPKLYDALINIGVPCVVRFLFDDVTKTDANDILTTQGVDALRGRLQDILDSSLAELDAAAQILAEKEKSTLDSDLINFLFQGDSSDLDFARRLERFCGSDVRWLKDDKSWLIFERNEFGGAVWTDAGEQNSCLLPFARQMTDLMIQHAESSDERKLAEKFKSTKKILQSVTLLKGSENILVTSDDLNQHSELLNVRNGVIDLTTGELLPAAPELLLSQKAAVIFDPKCTDKTFAEFFKSVLPDDDSRCVVERFLGYCLTADVSAEKYLLIHGFAGNGKGTTLLTLRSLSGDYACELPVDTVLESKSKFGDANGRATTELTPLVNRRIGIVDELPRGGRLDVAKVNRLTGGDYLPIRKLHREYKDVPPTHKLIMTGNYRPQIDDPRDKALLRRLIVVNFAQDFTQNPDLALKKKLLTDSALSGALNILVSAARDFYRDGLLEPSTLMRRAREDFLGENDFIGDFLFEHYEFGTGDDFAVKRKDLLKHLRDQCAECARYRDADLVAMLTKIDGVTCTKDRHGTNSFCGIRRKTEQQDNRDEFSGEIVSSDNWTPPI